MKPGTRSEQRVAWMLLIPALCSLLVFQYIPIGGLTIAFREFSWRAPFEGQYIGFRNFRALLEDASFIDAVTNTAVYAILAGAVITFSAVVIAGVFHLTSSITRRPRFSTLVLAPSFLSWVIVSLFVSRIFALRGTVNFTLMATGLVDRPVPFLTSPDVFPLVFITTTVWKYAGLFAFITWTLLQQIPPEIRESAAIDGLGPLGAFIRIELGWLKPQIAALALLCVLLLLEGFGEQALSMGSAAVRNRADVIESYLYRIGIQRGRWAISAAGSFIGALVRLPVAGALLLLSLVGIRRAPR